ncbi:MAG: flagellar basal body rod protein FlgB [bacterium]
MSGFNRERDVLKELIIEATPLGILSKSLDVYGMRQRAIAANIANAETPGYERKWITFEEQLRQLLRSQATQRSTPEIQHSLGDLSRKIRPQLVVDTTPSESNDINNVNIDQEMAQLAQNHLQFLIAARLTKHYFEMLNLSLKGV